LILALTGCTVKNKQTTAENENIKNVNTVEEIKPSETVPENIKESKIEVALAAEKEKEIREKEAREKKESETKAVEKTITPTIIDDVAKLSKTEIGWSWKYSLKTYRSMLNKYNGYSDGDTTKKYIYLTFDEGYENGNTPVILDVLKANNVKAAFFVTAPYVTGSYKGIKGSDLIKRMVSEGHIVGNHSVHHKSMATFFDETTFNLELKGVEEAVNKIPGAKMSNYFRPPMGKFSELSLYYTQKLGYKSIFFNFAYNDYDVNNQPAPEAAKATILKDSTPGMICLLHAISNTNTAILDSLIKEWRSQGYEFKTLDELP
jgi:peptidoglycan-N-acetylmuramic acid deacetylase